MIINHNVPALSTYNQLTKNNKATAKSLNKLSSGQAINSAADDASGLAISEKMRAQIRGLDQANVNSQDAISLIQTAEGNLGETEDILQRMRELADKAANDTKVASDREEIQKELNQLTNEINRIGNTTEFNTMKLLNGGGQETKIGTENLKTGAAAGQFGPPSIEKQGVAEVAGTYTINMAGGTATVRSSIAATSHASVNASGSAIVVNSAARVSVTLATLGFKENDTFTIDGQTFTFVQGAGDPENGKIGLVASGNNVQAQMGKILTAIKANDKLADRFDMHATGGSTLVFEEKALKAKGDSTLDFAKTGAVNLTGTMISTSVKAVAGEYMFTLGKTIQKAGENITIGGHTITSVAGDTPGVGQFKISDDIAEQAKSIAAAINSHAQLGNLYEATANSKGQITLTQRMGHTASITATSLMAATAQTQAATGIYNVDFKSVMKDGSKFSIDGVDIVVTSDAKDNRLSTGKAVLASDDLKTQKDRLVAAINMNADLKDKYNASDDSGKLHLVQKAGYQSLKTPVISTNTSSTDGFKAKMQIGANSYQSMTVEIKDMRALALGITGTKAGEQVIGSKGATAQLTSTKNVNNGTTDDNEEYALDLSSHENATAAIEVIDDAIQSVSAERSRLGAYQNRLEHTINNLGTSSQNMTEAESRIRDTDMAKEMMSFQKNNILSQAAQSMLAQANQLPQGVLQLLR